MRYFPPFVAPFVAPFEIQQSPTTSNAARVGLPDLPMI
jgi:hypothetical protein